MTHSRQRSRRKQKSCKRQLKKLPHGVILCGQRTHRKRTCSSPGSRKICFSFFNPTFWRLRRALKKRYDFSQHAVAPAWSKILGELSARHKAVSEWETLREQASVDWRVKDVDAIRILVSDVKAELRTAHPSVKALLDLLSNSIEASALIEKLVLVQQHLSELDAALCSVLAEHKQFKFQELTEVLGKLRKQTDTLAELSPILAELADLPNSFAYALRHAPVALNELEAAIAHKSLNRIYREIGHSTALMVAHSHVRWGNLRRIIVNG